MDHGPARGHPGQQPFGEVAQPEPVHSHNLFRAETAAVGNPGAIHDHVDCRRQFRYGGIDRLRVAEVAAMGFDAAIDGGDIEAMDLSSVVEKRGGGGGPDARGGARDHHSFVAEVEKSGHRNPFTVTPGGAASSILG